MTTTTISGSLLKQPARRELEDRSAPSFLAIGFRPFFFLATLVPIFWVPLWLFLLAGSTNANGLVVGHRLPAVALHAHEMIFGFTAAVIAGFLLTAAANWSGLPTTSGRSLALLALLWIAGRVGMLTNGLAPLIALTVDLAFLPALALTLAVPLIRARSFRNFQFVGMLALLSIANGLMHAGASAEFTTLTGLTWQSGSTLALRIITLMILVMGGRVIPMFTRNATQNTAISQRPLVDRLALATFGVASAADLVFQGAAFVGWLFIVAGLANVLRMRTWGTRSAKAPLLWILHAGYAAVSVSLLLEGVAVFGLIGRTIALHLLTIGGIGGLCLGMMTRVSLGHSGRMLSAPPTMTAAFCLVVSAALVRVIGPLVADSWVPISHQLSGVLFAGSYVLLLHFGAPIWFSPRVDRQQRNDQ